MRIGHYMTRMWEAGGVGSYVRRVSEAQRAAGHEVFYFDLLRHHHPDGWRGTVYVADERALFAEVQHRIDILHAHTLIESAHRSPVPIVRTAHNYEPICPSGGKFLARQRCACERRYSPVGCGAAHILDRCGSARPQNIVNDIRRTIAERRATSAIHVIAVSEYLRQEMIEGGYSPERVHALHPPASATGPATDTPEGPVRFLFLGRLTSQKGVDWLLRAAEEAVEQFTIDIAGKGNARAELEALTAKLDISNRVRFHGWVDAAGVKRLLDECRALVFPSLWPEPAGLVAFDAMARARAVIASRIGGIPELVNANTAMFVNPGDVSGLAWSLDRLATDVSLARKLGSAGYERVALFSIDEHLKVLHEIYQLAMSERAAGAAR